MHFEAGFDHHLSKPVNPEVFLDFIRRGPSDH